MEQSIEQENEIKNQMNDSWQDRQLDISQDSSVVWANAITSFRDTFSLKNPDVRAYSPLALAYIGDTVFDVIVRTVAVTHVNMAANKYHNKVCKYVSAVAQSEMVEILKPMLTDIELDIYKRGRNSKPYNKAKNASTMEYQRATGLEALVGYLYLDGQMPRLFELMKVAMEQLNAPKL